MDTQWVLSPQPHAPPRTNMRMSQGGASRARAHWLDIRLLSEANFNFEAYLF